jgi:hypothetical protein
MTMDERIKLGFDFAREIATQLIALSVGFLALTITFTKELVKTTPTAGSRRWLQGSWGLHVASVVFGVWSLLALTGTLIPSSSDTRPLGALTLGINVRLPAMLQIGSFVIGTLVMVIYAAISL